MGPAKRARLNGAVTPDIDTTVPTPATRILLDVPGDAASGNDPSVPGEDPGSALPSMVQQQVDSFLMSLHYNSNSSSR